MLLEVDEKVKETRSRTEREREVKWAPFPLGKEKRDHLTPFVGFKKNKDGPFTYFLSEFTRCPPHFLCFHFKPPYFHRDTLHLVVSTADSRVLP